MNAWLSNVEKIFFLREREPEKERERERERFRVSDVPERERDSK